MGKQTRNHEKILAFLAVVIFTFLLNGCGTEIYKDNPALQVEADTLTANVYFIRPTPVKTKPFADNKIRISYNGSDLLEIREGTYTLLKIKPGKGEVTTHSKTLFTGKSQPIDVNRSRLYTFVAGRTYFIYLDRINEEFRGVYYDPKPVDLQTAKTLVELDNLGASGLARQEPISAIKEVPPTPQTSPLEPVYPEQLYPKTPYILEKPVKE